MKELRVSSKCISSSSISMSEILKSEAFKNFRTNVVIAPPLSLLKTSFVYDATEVAPDKGGKNCSEKY